VRARQIATTERSGSWQRIGSGASSMKACYVQSMTLETIVIWIIVGLVAGVLASAVVGSGLGLLGDIIVGIIGAFVGGWLFRAIGISLPIGGVIGTIVVAFVGAVLLLLLIRLFRRATL
jgi:uncharacterized membrane protein YeaQ/YmgE (transglycosylase-associated protein family)